MLAPELENEIAELAARYTLPRRVVATLTDTAVDPISMDDRFGEVCMVLRRKNGLLLTAIKTFYPPGCFRLLTGGVEHGERVEQALWREIEEETGLEVTVARFLAVVEYVAADAPTQPVFVTYAFLLDEQGGELASHDPNERLESFREITVSDLPALAEALHHAPDAYSEDIAGNWRDWGEFRAVIHQVVYDLLS